MKMKEKIAIYERILHNIQLHKDVTMNHDKLRDLLDKISSWSYAHRCGNGELNNEKLVEEEMNSLKKFLNMV